ncbi:MAG: hypothetical protein PHW76_07500 [Alphaproteobacteria bacterium]|nr:hypothetical protein [Alphaproteobacteria bacterium]
MKKPRKALFYPASDAVQRIERHFRLTTSALRGAAGLAESAQGMA